MNIFFVRALTGAIALTVAGVAMADPADQSAASHAATAGTDPFPAEERTRLRARVSDLKKEAGELQRSASATRRTAYNECWQVTLVSACVERADAAYRESVAKARALEIEAGDIERDMQTRAASARRAEKQRAAEEKQHKSIEMSVKTRKTEEKRELDAATRAGKDANVAARAQQREEDMARRDAEQAEKRKREDARAAERAEDQRRRAAKIDERMKRKEEERARRDAEAAAREAKPRPQ